MKYKVKTYRSHKDFVYGSWKHEHHADGSTTIYGRLRKTGNMAKYQDVYSYETK